MTQPDEWTEKDTDNLGDLAYSKLEAEVTHLRSLYTHEHAIAQESLDRALGAEAQNRHLIEKLAIANGKVEQGFRMFETAIKLGQYAEREKRLAHGTERAYWQGTCDACRKLNNAYRGEGMFMDLFKGALDNSVQVGG